MTVNEEALIRSVVVRLEHSGIAEVDGDYLFRDIRFDAGFYARKGTFRGREVTFTLYKCSLKNGGYQWFISITPEGCEPGTADDIDFYYGHAKAQDRLPTLHFMKMNPDPHHISREPAPLVTIIYPDAQLQGEGSHSNQPDETAETVGQSSDSEGDRFAEDTEYGPEDSFATYMSGDQYYE